MSAYLAYAPKTGMPEANRTVVSNIYSGGLNAVEAGAYIAELIGRIFACQASGVNLGDRK
jgi:ethanolamine ammonia-lyase small subunit